MIFQTKKKSEEKFFKAAQDGDRTALKKLKRVDVDCKQKDSDKSALHIACEYGHHHTVRYLVDERGANMNITERFHGDTPLHLACRHGHIFIVKYFIEERRMEVNIRSKDGSTPLHEASSGGSLEVVKYLIERCGSHIDARNKENSSPLHSACANNSLGVAQYLVKERGANVKDTTKSGETPLYCALLEGHIDAAIFLINDCGVDSISPFKDGIWPIHLASRCVNTYLVEFLVTECGADVNVVTSDGRTPLHFACQEDFELIDMVRYLVEQCSADVHSVASDGSTPLHDACRSEQDQVDTVKYLVEQCGASIHIKDKSGETPLGCTSGEEVRSYLLERIKLDPPGSDTQKDAIEGPSDSWDTSDGGYSDSVESAEVSASNKKADQDSQAATFASNESRITMDKTSSIELPFDSQLTIPVNVATSPIDVWNSNESSHPHSASTANKNTARDVTNEPNIGLDASPPNALDDLHDDLERSKRELHDHMNILKRHIADGAIVGNLKGLSEHSHVIHSLVRKEVMTQSEQSEIDAIVSSDQYEFYISFMERLHCSILASKALSTDRVACKDESLLAYASGMIREVLQNGCQKDSDASSASGMKQKRHSRDSGGRSFAGLVGRAAKQVGKAKLFPYSESIGSVVHYLLTMKEEDDRKKSIRAVSKFATILDNTMGESVNMDRTIERAARILVHHSLSSDDDDTIDAATSKWANKLPWKQHAVDSSSRMQAHRMADIGLACIMEGAEGGGSLLWKTVVERETRGGVDFGRSLSVHYALVASILDEDIAFVESIAAPKKIDVLQAQPAVAHRTQQRQETIPYAAPDVTTPATGSSNVAKEPAGASGADLAANLSEMQRKFEQMNRQVNLLQRNAARSDNNVNGRVVHGLVYARADFREQYRDRVERVENQNEEMQRTMGQMALMMSAMQERLDSLERQNGY